MSETRLYPNDTPIQTFMDDIAATEIGDLIEQYTLPTGDGGQEIKVEEFSRFRMELAMLIKKCEYAAWAEFKDKVRNIADLRDDAEKVVTRKALMYISERCDISMLRETLNLSDVTKGSINMVLEGASENEM